MTQFQISKRKLFRHPQTVTIKTDSASEISLSCASSPPETSCFDVGSSPLMSHDSISNLKAKAVSPPSNSDNKNRLCLRNLALLCLKSPRNLLFRRWF